MLERIAEIKGVGLLHDANGKLHTCKKATFIYADNGRGKSTLASVMRSVSTNAAALISNRKTIDGTIAPQVVLQFGSGHKVTFNGAGWSEHRPDVIVFDSDFIEQNVHSGGSVTTGQRKNLLDFALGDAAVNARRDVETATASAKSANEKMQTITAQLEGYRGTLLLTQFESLPPNSNAPPELTDLQTRITAATNVAAIQSKLVPSQIGIPELDIDGIFDDLSVSLEDIHAGAEAVVKAHVAGLHNKAAESWISEGQKFDDSANCPYCGQDTSSNDLIGAYRTHFNAAYSSLKSKVVAQHTTVLQKTSATVVSNFSQAAVVAQSQLSTWENEISAQAILFDQDEAGAALTELQALLSRLTAQKQASPAESTGNPEQKALATALWQRVLAPMRQTNLTIQAATASINAYRAKLAGENVQQLQQQLSRIEATQRRHTPVVVKLIDDLAAARTEARTAEATKKIARETLDTLMTSTLEKYQKSINALLKEFGAAFSISGMSANFRGAAPRSEYGLLLRNKPIPLEGGAPTFATALSEGDKRTLAFAFFVASTLADPKLAQRIVVIDDPMCSLDANRKHHTGSVLKNIYNGAEQLIVLAHDAYFIQDTRNALLKSDSTAKISIFQLSLSADDYTDFAKLDIDETCESAYFRHHRLLNNFVNGNGSDSREVAKAIRPMLEEYLHLRFPLLIGKNLLFGEVVQRIRDAVAPSPLCHAANLVNELSSVNDYAGKFHHGTNPVTVTASELKAYVDRALAIVHKGA